MLRGFPVLNLPYIHRIYMVMANPIYVCVCVLVWCRVYVVQQYTHKQHAVHAQGLSTRTSNMQYTHKGCSHAQATCSTRTSDMQYTHKQHGKYSRKQHGVRQATWQVHTQATWCRVAQQYTHKGCPHAQQHAVHAQATWQVLTQATWCKTSNMASTHTSNIQYTHKQHAVHVQGLSTRTSNMQYTHKGCPAVHAQGLFTHTATCSTRTNNMQYTHKQHGVTKATWQIHTQATWCRVVQQ